ncbi:type II CRISPR-associated endonuclease Cas1 [Neisseria weixii]|uniref:type II CRISPR-associated endonuclease Cas1 n=1 Tax=Neisseria weixii TaxID=1853276 RepID=UPI000BB71D0A|nr:type II CRISPR-associated endonuclease Cas1 [Neisseria weixii]ATD64699.1 subtype II CRISPR-associated endonuclease Cas1 [Neisseria weixii]
MTWRSVLIQNSSKLSLLRKQLNIQQEGESYTVPLEDIAVIVVENHGTLITAPLLSALAENGVTLLTCDEQFLPCGQWLPFSQYHRQLKTLKLQIYAGEPIKKQLWQKIVKQKILNQAFCVDETGNDIAAKRLRILASEVKSGDNGNQEAQAAALYFQVLFGERFTRTEDNEINAHLNYAYAVLRAAVARSLVLYGWLPALGLFHKSELNPFNLADDFIEPLRPLADLMVIQLKERGRLREQLNTMAKQQLISVLHHQMMIEQQSFSTLAAIDKMISSFQTALSQKNARFLKLPELQTLKAYQYE